MVKCETIMCKPQGSCQGVLVEYHTQWAAGGFEEFLNIMNFYVFLIVWDNRVNKL